MVSSHSVYMQSPHSLNIQAWLKEGLILQTDKGILIGEGPLVSSDRPGRGFFHPDFFLEKKQPWIFPRKIFFTTKAFMENWLNDTFMSNSFNQATETISSTVQGKYSLQLQASGGGLQQPSRKEVPFPHEGIFSLNKKPQFSNRRIKKTKEQPSFTEFHTVFAQLQQQIKQGVLKKGVPVLFEKIKGKTCVLTLLKTLFQKTAPISHEGFLYGVWNANGGILGFTPETLFSFSGRNISLMALAGTAPWPGPSLFHDPKEMQEHQWVIQSLKNALKNQVIWNTSHTREKKFGSLKHLCTNIEGTLKKSSDFTLLCQKLHPTAALSGFPKQAALQWLKANPQQKNRGHFGAPFGFFDGKDKGFCLVSLRGVEWDSEGLRIGTGCGLVKNSVLQKEWRELTLKRNQIKQFFT